MKKACIAVFIILLMGLPALAQDKKAAEEVRELQQKLNELRQEISRLHLLNTLEVTLEQAQEIKTLLDNLKLGRELLNQQQIANQKEMVEILEKIRDAYKENNGDAPDELIEKYNEIRKQANEANRGFFKQVTEADKELNTILTEGQKKTIKNYDEDPLRPEKDGPQGKGSRLAQVAKLLDRIRGMTPEQLEQAKGKLMQQFLGRLVKDGNMPKQRMQAAQRKVEEILRKAQALDDFEYMLWREEFAKQLLDLTKPQKRQAKRADKRQKGPELSKAGAMLLDEGMLKALEIKIEALKKAGIEQDKHEKPGKQEPQEK
jgi:hypothetical protein